MPLFLDQDQRKRRARVFEMPVTVRLAFMCGEQEGSTAGANDSPSEINDFDAAIRRRYRRGTPEI